MKHSLYDQLMLYKRFFRDATQQDKLKLGKFKVHQMKTSSYFVSGGGEMLCKCPFHLQQIFLFYLIFKMCFETILKVKVHNSLRCHWLSLPFCC